MIAQEGQPVLGLLSSSFRLDHVLANFIRGGRVETEKHQMPMNPLAAPERIFATESSDQSAHSLADGRAPSFAPQFPAPPQAKNSAMPFENSLGLHQVGS